MVAIGISEFTYAYAFLHEQQLIWQNELLITPFLPSLSDEALLGFDAALATTATCFFYQFKKSRYIVRAHPRRLARNPQPYPTPFYRILLHRKRNYSQHFRLKEWSQLFPCTFYVAPEMNDNTTFYQAARRGELWMNSRFIFLNLCQETFTENDPEQHFIEFKEGEEQPLICSEHGFKIEKSLLGKNLKEFYLGQKRQPIDELAANLFGQTEAIITKHWGNEIVKKLGIDTYFERIQKTETKKILQFTSNILSTYLGIIPVFVGNRERKDFDANTNQTSIVDMVIVKN